MLDRACAGQMQDDLVFVLPDLATRSASSKPAPPGAGPVRTPLIDLNAQECEQLDALIKALGPQ